MKYCRKVKKHDNAPIIQQYHINIIQFIYAIRLINKVINRLSCLKGSILTILKSITYSFCALFSLSSTHLLAANQTISPVINNIDYTSTDLPLAENNSLQVLPEYQGTDQQLIDPIQEVETTVEKTEKAELASKENEDDSHNEEYEPAFTNSAWEQFEVDESFYDSPYQVSLFSPKNGEDSERLLSQTSSIFYYGLGVISALAVMPTSITNWESDGDQSLTQKWTSNVTGGPVWDRDDAVLNLVMHPYFGGAYYQTARKSGYRQWDSFLYSALMSTVFWEYGVEAFAETPSMQDLVVTPVLGWVYGEWAFNKEREIWAGGGTVWGSEYLGNTALFILDPIDSIGRNVNRLFGRDLIKAGTGYVKISEQNDSGPIPNDKQIMFEINYAFGEENSKAQSGISGNRQRGYSFTTSKDPVDTGIVGLSLGTGYLTFGHKRHLENEQYAELSLGLYFSRSFSSRLSYSSTKLLQALANPQITYETFSVDGQYYFNTESNLRPYLTAGIGEEIFDEDDDQYSFQVNAGAGIHYRLNAKWAIQADVVDYFTTDTGSHDQQMTGRVIYRFGNGETM